MNIKFGVGSRAQHIIVVIIRQCTVGKHVVLGIFADNFLKVFKSADLCRIQNKKCRLKERTFQIPDQMSISLSKQVRKSWIWPLNMTN